MTRSLRSCLVLAAVAVSMLMGTVSAGLAAERQMAEPDTAWAASMKAVHEKFQGERGTFAQFGDSITVSGLLVRAPIRPQELVPRGHPGTRLGRGLHAGRLLGLERTGVRQPRPDDRPLGPPER